MCSLKHSITLFLALCLVSVLAGFGGSSAQAAGIYDGKELADQDGCPYCHQLDEKKLGPAYKDIAARYKGDAQAMTKMRKSFREGSRDKWPGVAEIMRPHNEKKVADDDLDTILRWILSLAP